jgi:hypothetical protein
MAKPFPSIGMSPAVWGPIVWTTMHIVTIGYSEMPTEEEKKAAIDFFESLVYMIPCPICREHYKMILEKHPVKNAVGSRDELADWAFMIHNEVNEQISKPKITNEQYIKNLKALSDLESFKIPPQKEMPTHSLPLLTGIGLLVGVGIGAAGVYYYQKNK